MSPVSVLSSMTYTVDSLERKNVVASPRAVTSQKVATKRHELRRVNCKTSDASAPKDNSAKTKTSGLRAPAPVTSQSNVRKTPTSLRKQGRGGRGGGGGGEEKKGRGGGLLDYPIDESIALQKSRKDSEVDTTNDVINSKD